MIYGRLFRQNGPQAGLNLARFLISHAFFRFFKGHFTDNRNSGTMYSNLPTVQFMGACYFLLRH